MRTLKRLGRTPPFNEFLKALMLRVAIVFISRVNNSERSSSDNFREVNASSCCSER